jgi:hypothetical protein
MKQARYRYTMRASTFAHGDNNNISLTAIRHCFRISPLLLLVMLFSSTNVYVVVCVCPQLTDETEIQRCIDEATSRVALGKPKATRKLDAET